MINEMIGHFEEKMKKNIQFWMMQMKTKKFQKKYKEVWESVKKEIETIIGNKKVEYGKDLKNNVGSSLMTICQ